MPSAIIENLDLKIPSFRPSKWPRKEIAKIAKIVNCENCQKTVLSQLKKVGGHRYPPGSYNEPKNSFTNTSSLMNFSYAPPRSLYV
jgi:hypothetical protein